MSDIADVIVIDDDELDEFEDYRNARARRAIVRGRPGGTSRRRPTAIVQGRTGGAGGTQGMWRRSNAGPVLRADTGGLSYGVLIDAGAQVLAAIQPLPTAPVATGCANTDVGNLMIYQRALAEHAKRDEQLRTLGSLASKFLA